MTDAEADAVADVDDAVADGCSSGMIFTARLPPVDMEVGEGEEDEAKSTELVVIAVRFWELGEA